MRILHCCLAQFYVDSYGYQENVLPAAHRRDGHDVAIVASTETYIDNAELGYVKPSSYISAEGIPITRLAYSRGLPHKLARKLRFYRGLYRLIVDFDPDILFLHDCQFLGVHSVARFVSSRPKVTVYVDSHTDFGNSARSWLSRNILHRLVYRHCVRVIEPYVTRFYGTLPVRVSFLEQVYGTDSRKTELLELGADDSKIHWERSEEIRSAYRAQLGLRESDYLIVSGGKIDRRKDIVELMKWMTAATRDDIHLAVFGTPSAEMRNEFEMLSASDSITSLGWLSTEEVYELFLAADLAVFPGTHSVLWEQATGTGCPCIFRKWPGVTHLDVGGNCIFVASSAPEELSRAIEEVLDTNGMLSRMSAVAATEGVRRFSYSEIARRAIHP